MCSTSCFARGDQSAYRLLRNLQQFPSDTGQLGQVPGVTTVLLYLVAPLRCPSRAAAPTTPWLGLEARGRLQRRYNPPNAYALALGCLLLAPIVVAGPAGRGHR